MRPNHIVFILVVIVLLSAPFFFITPLHANDGRDRYAVPLGEEFWLFPDAGEYMAGYRVLAKDGPGGADGDRAFRWARPQAIALVRIAAYETEKTLGKGNHPMPIFDLSAENGDTPVNFYKSRPPKGRHPGGSHDGGINLDLGYYLTSLKGLHYTPDHSACSDHFKKSPGKNKKPRDAYICNGPPDRLDVERQAFFMLKLMKINRDLFNCALIEQIGMDWEIQKAIVKQIGEWVSGKTHDAQLQYLTDMRNICTADSYDGWSHSHHHHLHLRLHGISIHGQYREAFLTLFKQERELDRVLLEAARGTGEPLLRTRLRSYKMNRAIQAEILGDIPQDTSVRFRLKNHSKNIGWQDPDPSITDSIKAVLELPMKVRKRSANVVVEAEIRFPDGTKKTVTDTVVLPRKEPHLFVAVDPSCIHASYKRQGNQWQLKVIVPDAYKIYITRVSFEVFRQSGSASRSREYEASIIDYSFTLDNTSTMQQAPVLMIRANVTLSSRVKLRIPVYCAVN